MKASLSDNPLTVNAQQEFASKQQAAYNRAIAKTMGEDAEAITPDVIQNAKTRLGDIYDQLFDKYGSKISGQTYKDLARIRDEAMVTLPDTEKPIIKNIFDEDPSASNVLDNFQYGYDPRYGDPTGRTYYLRGTYKF